MKTILVNSTVIYVTEKEYKEFRRLLDNTLKVYNTGKSYQDSAYEMDKLLLKLKHKRRTQYIDSKIDISLENIERFDNEHPEIVKERSERKYQKFLNNQNRKNILELKKQLDNILELDLLWNQKL